MNNLSPDIDDDDSVEHVNCKYYDIEQFKTLKSLNNKNALSMFHLNTCSLVKNFEDLEHLLNSTEINFDVIAISKTRIIHQ